MISIAITDDSTLFRHALKSHLNGYKDIFVLFVANNGRDLLNQLQGCTTNLLPDIILLDLEMPVMDGRHAAKQVHEKYPSIKIILMSLFHHEHLVFELLHNGVRGFITKNIEPEELMKVIQKVNNNKLYVEQEIISAADHCRQNSFPAKLNTDYALTETQKTFLKLCAKNYSYKTISQQMNVSLKTVNEYRDKLFEVLNTNTRNGLVIYAIQIGIVDRWDFDNDAENETAQ